MVYARDAPQAKRKKTSTPGTTSYDKGKWFLRPGENEGGGRQAVLSFLEFWVLVAVFVFLVDKIR